MLFSLGETGFATATYLERERVVYLPRPVVMEYPMFTATDTDPLFQATTTY